MSDRKLPRKLPQGPWHQVSGGRITFSPAKSHPLTRRFWLWLTRQRAKTTRDLNVFLALAKLGPIFPRYLLFLAQLLQRGRLSRIDKERIILRVAYRMGCIYEWGHHTHFADELGISDAEVRSLAEPGFASSDERICIFVAGIDELIDQRVICDATWARLSTVLTEEERVEFCMLVGHYIMVAGMINSVGVRLEPGYLEGIGD